MTDSKACLFALVLFALCPSAQSAEPVDVATALAASIIGPQLALSEVQVFTETRVPPMPEVSTVAQWEKYTERLRSEFLQRVVFRGEAAKWRTSKLQVEWLETIPGGPGYSIRKLRYEALPGLWIPALLYVPDTLRAKVPVVLNVNGHDRPNGKAAVYKQLRCINQAKRGMLALNVEWLGMGQLQTENFSHYRMNQLDLCGTSGVAPFYLSMSRGLDVLLSLENADAERVAVAGLSGGGWQTIFISSLDPRVTFSDPVAGYSSFRTRAYNFSDLGDSEQTPTDMATVADYAQLTALRAPRPTLLTFNARDNCCFAAGHALPPLLAAARPIYALYGKRDFLHAHVNFDPGTHNFDQDNRQALYRMLGVHFFPDDKDFDHHEIPSDEEIKTKAQLNVEIPADNADFHTLALALSQDLPRTSKRPANADQQTAWQTSQRKLLTNIVSAHDYEVTATQAGSEQLSAGDATYWKLRLDETWTVPAVELVRGEPKATAIVFADAGRQSLAKQTEVLLSQNYRVIAIDPFYLGESKIAQRDFLFALLVATVGERPLGLQASQLAAVARWSTEKYADQPVRIIAHGPRTSLAACVAAALEPTAINSLALHGSLNSLKDVITENMSVNTAPELFCFGLLEQFDIPQLQQLVTPRTIDFVGQEPDQSK